jgi:predicted permease
MFGERLHELWLRLKALVRRRELDRDLDDELAFHLAMREEKLREQGVAAEEAPYAARRQFGNVTQVKETSRELWGFRWLETFVQDLRYGARQLKRNPGFTAVAIITLALGIGANTAIFRLMNSVRLRMLPVMNPQELAEVKLTTQHGRLGSFFNWHPIFTNALWEQIRDHQQAFSGVFAWAPETLNLAPRGEAHLVPGLWVSGDYFNVLGVQPFLGRVFTTLDDQRGCGSSGAVVSYSFWQRELGGVASAIGRRLTIDYHPVEVIGVTPPGFFGLEVGRSFDVALPICSQPVLGGEDNYLDVRYDWWLTVMGRLKPGWSLEKATAQLGAISPGIFEATLPPGYDADHARKYLAFKLAAYPAGTGISSLRQDYSDPLWLLLAITGLVLLIACANLANLLLARARAREREIAVRLALGASRGRLLRQLLSESLLLGIVGAGLGLFLAGTLARFLVSFLSTQGNRVFVDLSPDWRVFGFTAAVAILTCLLFGLAPALRATGIAPGAAMKAGGRGLTASRERFGLHRTLVVSQVALSLVLLVGALLFTRSLRNLLTLDAGFQRSGILITSMDLTQLNLPATRRQAFDRELLAQLRSTPGVDAAAEAAIVPTSGSSMNRMVWMDGLDSAQAKTSWFNLVSGDFFKTMRTPLLAGRDFDSRDTFTSPKVAIVNEAFARQLAHGTNPVGKTFWQKGELGDRQISYVIVGLVKDTKYENIREPFAPVVYVPTSQDANPDQTPQILIRSSVPLADLTSRVKQTIAGVNPEISIDFQALQTMIRDGLVSERLMATLSGFFGFLATLLATIGLYGVMSYMVIRRTNEIGIRIALGGDCHSILRMILRDASMLLGIGLAAGTALALTAGRIARALLFGLQPHDPLTMGIAVVLLAAVALAAAYLPARRASRVDLMSALRYE